MPPRPQLHHVALMVTDLTRSAAWYREVLGLEEPVPRDGPTWQRVLLRSAGFALSLLVTCRDPDGIPIEFYWPVG